jgi:hypothetical protein
MRDHFCTYIPRRRQDPTDPPVIQVCECGWVLLHPLDPRIAIPAPQHGPSRRELQA